MWRISYWLLPVVSGCVWLGMLIAMLVVWNVQGQPHYESMHSNQNIAYISDIGAETLKPLFIAGCTVTAVFVDLAFISERWLRHLGRLARNKTVTEKALRGLSIIFSIVGTVGLILLSVYDTLRYHQFHDIFLLLFISGYIVSAVFICWEYQRLGIQYREHIILRMSFWIKLTFILLEVALAIGFGVSSFKKIYNAAAVLEWAIAFIFSFYVFSFFIDLLPAVRTKHHSSKTTVMQMEQSDGLSNQHQAIQYGSGTANSLNGHNDQYIQNGQNEYAANGVFDSNGPNPYRINNF